MSQIALHRSLSWMTACSDIRQSEQADTSHGWRDKSTDCRRVHVVGGVDLSDRTRKGLAGAFLETRMKSMHPAPSLILN